jgi:ABC-type phosphate transport system permease subunit
LSAFSTSLATPISITTAIFYKKKLKDVIEMEKNKK